MKECSLKKIQAVQAREILDSRGQPTVEVDIMIKGEAFSYRAAVPSGASTGLHEAVELRDGNKSRYCGKGVLKAVQNVNLIIAKKLVGKNVFDQVGIDQAMIKLDGTPNKDKLGANAILAVSLAVARAGASLQDVPLYYYLGGPNVSLLPTPMMNIINGGIHANWQGPDIQEFMICPIGAPNFKEAVRWCAETYQALKVILKKQGHSVLVGDEGGFAPAIKSNREVLDIIVEAIKSAGYAPGSDISLALDSAASSFYEDGAYKFRSENRELSAEELIFEYVDWWNNYPIISLEDGLAEDDWPAWKALTEELGERIKIVGDDLFVTNTERLKYGINEKSANAILIKLNQIGTLTETIATINMAKKANWNSIVSHRSGETWDTFIADFVVAMGTGAIKTGAPCRGERVEKYNQLIRIEEALGKEAVYAGPRAFI